MNCRRFVRLAWARTNRSWAGFRRRKFFCQNAANPAKGDSVNVLANRVSADYFETLNIAVIEGRAFTMRDDEVAPRVAVINETMARALTGRDKAPSASDSGSNVAGPPVEIVGVVAEQQVRIHWRRAAPVPLPALRAELPVGVNSLFCTPKAIRLPVQPPRVRS